ncbi:hypothetical protein Rt10032_c07g3157 [Rhodotorula toruloides]|uniref:Uncharacterized protein n=1 Tax=Rhodotorula toruloides TaxID=5286 RepID=A0A511KFJ1_RHOTO|nr:hypothetical protein Rt10032_c07g3157 [Rhodotorula toruloides]
MFASSSSIVTAAFALLATANSAFAGKTPSGVFNGNSGSTKIDYQPAFTSPKGGEVWLAGHNYFASWNQKLPEGISVQNVSQTANLVLGYTAAGSQSLNLNWTLASNVSLYPPAPNTVNFQLPSDLPPRNSYFLVLLGSSRNQSPKVTILPDILPTHTSPNASSIPSVPVPSGAASGVPTGAGKGNGQDEQGEQGGQQFGRFARRVAGSRKARLDN